MIESLRSVWLLTDRLLESVLNLTREVGFDLTNVYAKLTTKVPLPRNTPGLSKVLL